MEKLCLTGAKMLKCVDVPIVHIKESVCGKFDILLHSSEPLFDCCIELRSDTSVISYPANGKVELEQAKMAKEMQKKMRKALLKNMADAREKE